MRGYELTYYRGRVGLHAILEALGVGDGDEVITQAYTCVAVPEAILATGARPVFADVEARGLNIDVASMRARITNATKAIIAQHTFGLPAAMDEIMASAAEHGLPVIEDCCHTLSGRLGDRALGEFGVASFYSYEWGKPLVVGVGGSVQVNDGELAIVMRAAHARYRRPSMLRQLKLGVQYVGFGAVYHPRLYWPVRSAFRRLSRLGAVEGNYNTIAPGEMDDDFRLDMAPMQRVLLAVKRRAIDSDAARRRTIVARYLEALQPYDGLFPEPSGADVVYARLPLQVSDKSGLLRAARKAGIELAEWYTTPVHPFSDGELRDIGYQPGSCLQAEKRCASVVSLPTHARVTDRFVDRACAFLKRGAG